MTLPGRGPKTPDERMTDAVRSQPVQSGDGAVHARKADRRTPTAAIPASAVVVGDTTGQTNAIAITATNGSGGGDDESIATDGYGGIAIGPTAEARSNFSVAVGYGAAAGSGGLGNGTAVGKGAGAIGEASTALGTHAVALEANGVAIGNDATAHAAGSVAIGCDSSFQGADATNDNEFMLGTDRHLVIVKGFLMIADNVGGLHRLVVSTGGALSTVPYP